MLSSQDLQLLSEAKTRNKLKHIISYLLVKHGLRRSAVIFKGDGYLSEEEMNIISKCSSLEVKSLDIERDNISCFLIGKRLDQLQVKIEDNFGHIIERLPRAILPREAELFSINATYKGKRIQEVYIRSSSKQEMMQLARKWNLLFARLVTFSVLKTK